MNVEMLPEMDLPPVLIEDDVLQGWCEFGDKNQKGRPPPKIQGTEHKWREQKQIVKKIIRIPWFPKPKPKP